MKRRLISFLLVVALLFNVYAFSGCNKPSGDEHNENEDEKKEYFTCDCEPSSEITREKLEGALADAIAKIDYALPTFTDKFPSHNSTNNVYSAVNNDNGWNTGFWTGILWHAYELTGDVKYRDVATSQIDSFYYRIDNKIGVNHHDMGFLYTPSCVAAYKLTGNVQALWTTSSSANSAIS